MGVRLWLQPRDGRECEKHTCNESGTVRAGSGECEEMWVLLGHEIRCQGARPSKRGVRLRCEETWRGTGRHYSLVPLARKREYLS